MKRVCTWLAAVIVTSVTFTASAQDAAGGAAARIVLKPQNRASFLAKVTASRAATPGTPILFSELDLGTFAVQRAGTTPEALLATLATMGEAFEYAEPERVFAGHGRAVPEDPEFTATTMWALQAISAPQAWLHGQGSRNVVAAIVDSGIDALHEDLADNIWRPRTPFRLNIGGGTLECGSGDFGYDAIDDDCRPQEREQHGTNVSGIIGARGDNAIGTVGVNWKVTLLPVAFLGAGNEGASSRAAKALQFIRQLKERGLADIRVVNLSWGSHEHSRLIEDELLRLAEAGVVIVTSAGNDASDNDTRPVYPAGYDTVSTLISVAATRSDGELARSSNRGRYSVDIAAPGIGVRTTDPGNSYDSPFGTSMAAALVTGAVALLASQCPALTAVQLKRLVLATADRKSQLALHVADGRFLNVVAAAEKCAALEEHQLH